MRGCCRMATLHLTGLVARSDGIVPAEAQPARPVPATPRGSAANWAPACVPTAHATSLPDAGAGVLITRPEPGASETAARVNALGLRPIVAPLLTIRTLPRPAAATVRVQAILVTSGNAIPACRPATTTCRCSRWATTTAATRPRRRFRAGQQRRWRCGRARCFGGAKAAIHPAATAAARRRPGPGQCAGWATCAQRGFRVHPPRGLRSRCPHKASRSPPTPPSRPAA